MAPPPPEPISSSSSDLTLMDPEPMPSENTPLITGKSTDEAENGAHHKPSKPLPHMQVFLLCFAKVMEPIAFFAIFPFIAEMVAKNGNLPKSDVGFYSGLIESLFSATQMVVLYFWGHLADTIGRKPVLLWTLAGMTVGTFFFTVSTTIWQMILFRCIAGVFSGSGLVIRTMLSDHTTSETQAVAFSWFAFANNMGIFLGPIIGGVLADPVEQFPSVFKGIQLLEDYPYLLAGVALTVINIVSIVLCIFYLEETLEPEATETTSSTAGPVIRPHRLSTRELLKAPGVGVVIWVYTHVMFLAFAFTAILPVLLYTPIKLGGVGFSAFQISLWMATQGAAQAAWLVIAFPFLQRRIGTKGSMAACVAAYPFFFAGYVLMNFLLRADTESAMAAFWVVAPIVAVVGPGVSMAFTAVQLALNDVSPNPHVMGTLNALAMTAASAVRSFVPGVSTVLFAIGVHNQILWGHLVWAILIPIAMSLMIFVKWLPEDKQSHKLAREREEDED
ncbi:putative peptide/nitrate transporter [Trichoderma lentiforme]|uniref:Peptide/nitrate transporter n=1 Tax=Trichoderma lentiforme TaxID=1567552 RepID=A0A9P4XNV7_9HYPO|nr:putative peptide/nitrate transporter [Trichoderma lentiforme]